MQPLQRSVSGHLPNAEGTTSVVFGPSGITVTTFVDPERSNRVGLIADVPDMATDEEVMASDAAAEAMKTDGVRPETMVVVEG